MIIKRGNKLLRYTVEENYVAIEILNMEYDLEYAAIAEYRGGEITIESASRISEGVSDRIGEGLRHGGRLASQDVPPLYLIQELFRVMQGEWHGRTMEAHPSDARRTRCYIRACKRAGVAVEKLNDYSIAVTF